MTSPTDMGRPRLLQQTALQAFLYNSLTRVLHGYMCLSSLKSTQQAHLRNLSTNALQKKAGCAHAVQHADPQARPRL